MKRRYVILASGEFLDNAKTAQGVIAYASDEVVAVIDPDHSGKTVTEVVPHLRSDAPFVNDLQSALAYRPTALLIGVAPPGGALPQSWRDQIVRAIEAGLEIVSGLHDLLAEDPEFAAAAKKHAVRIWDVRVPPTVPLFSGAVYDVQSPILLTVGSDCAVGKMTVSLELVRAARERGKNATFVPTGQTGIMIAGWGISVDRVISDFAPGAAEQLVLQADSNAELIVVEGQGSINHPAYAPVTLSLMYGSAPDVLVLVIDPTQRTIGNHRTPTLGYPELIAAYENVCGFVKPAKVIGIALNTRALSETQARDEIANARSLTGLPVDDVVRNGPHAFYDAIAPAILKGQPLTTEVLA
ncbi:MAG: DUF1611 domain-containing protein [Candidatus Eremiobacteraeota bacterium]|nr:DUF1611 domain-containing protein [Candidatus Eremiobacteraeota bacterium]